MLLQELNDLCIEGGTFHSGGRNGAAGEAQFSGAGESGGIGPV